MREVVPADPGVCIQIKERLVLARDQKQEASQQRVLEHVREVAGVKQVAIGEHEREAYLTTRSLS